MNWVLSEESYHSFILGSKPKTNKQITSINTAEKEKKKKRKRNEKEKGTLGGNLVASACLNQTPWPRIWPATKHHACCVPPEARGSATRISEFQDCRSTSKSS
jgi:hypothetical protein